MLLARHLLETTAKPGAVWKLLASVSAWPTWDQSLAFARLDGALLPGSRGFLRRRGELQRSLVIERVEEGKAFQFRMRFLFARLRYVLTLEKCRIGSRVTCLAEIEGPMAWLYGRTMRRKCSEQMSDAARTLARMAANKG
jgi:hypothetical protein